MFCEKCGNKIKEGNTFCTNCGTRVSDNKETEFQTNTKKR